MLNAIAVTGNRVLYRNLHATITTLPNSRVVLSFDNEKQDPIIKSRREIESEFGKTLHLIPKDKVAAPKALDLSIADLDELKRRSAYIEELDRLTTKGGIGGVKIRRQVIARVARKIEDRHPISPATLGRWAREAKTHSHGIASTLSAKTRHRRSSFSQDIQDFALEMIDDYYLKLGNPTVQYAYDCFTEEFKEKFGDQEKRPCREVFRKWAKQSHHPIEIIERREGKRAAKAASRNATKRIQTERILERVEADAVNLAIGVRNEDGQYLGPVTLFAVIDVHSRAILGLIPQIGKGESSGSVIDSYKHAICPKGPDALPATVQNDWPMYGLPEMFVSDGGSGYCSLETHTFVTEAGSQSQTVQTYAGWHKPFIERFFNTLRTRFAQTLHSYCGKYTERPDLDATISEKASMTLQQFRVALYEWVVDEYHQTPHRGLNNETPYEVWKKYAEESPPYVPNNFARIQFTLGETKVCTISGAHGHHGIQLNNLRYNDPDSRLKRICMILRAKNEPAEVDVQYTHNDLSSVNVLDPIENEWFRAFATDSRIEQGTTLAEWKALRKSHYADKGYTGPRNARSSQVVNEMNKTHKENMRRVRSRQTQPTPEKRMNNFIRESMEEGEDLGFPNIGSELMSTQTSEVNEIEYGVERKYEDD